MILKVIHIFFLLLFIYKNNITFSYSIGVQFVKENIIL